MPIYMQYDGVDGSVTAAGHERWIELSSISMGMLNSPGTGQGSAPSVSEIVVTKATDRSTPKLMQFCADGKFARQAIVELTTETANGEQVYMQYKLPNVLVTSYQTGADGHSYPSESMSLNFTKVEFKHIEYASDGSVLLVQEGNWPGSR